jgi:uracil-DNA glycosylase
MKGEKIMSIIPNSWHSSWNDFMTEENILLLKQIENKIGNNFVPEEKNVLRFLQRDLSEIKCVWLGQDPYYTMYDENKYVANGAAFWPNDLQSWLQPFSQKSLQNIIRLIYKNYNNITNYKDIKSYKEIKQEIENKSFNILPPQQWFQSLEDQGVLLLNIYLTTEKGSGNKHQKIWSPFSILLLKYISLKNKNISWFLWGNEAQSKEEYIKDGKIYKSNHPTFCSEKYENDFLKNECFNETKNIINWLGEV